MLRKKTLELHLNRGSFLVLVGLSGPAGAPGPAGPPGPIVDQNGQVLGMPGATGATGSLGRYQELT